MTPRSSRLAVLLLAFDRREISERALSYLLAMHYWNERELTGLYPYQSEGLRHLAARTLR